MRGAFFVTLEELAEADERVHLVVADLGFGVVERFAGRFPGRFLNVGVAEQNMTGIAVGLALSGRIVFTYSIANFPTLRCLEQVRNDVCYHAANVKIVAVGGGFSYGALGMSHHATEDIAVMRALPGMMVVAPGDPVEVREATRGIAAEPGPCYLRLGRSGEAVVHRDRVPFRLGRAIQVRDGWDLTLIATGAVLGLAVTAAELLAREGIQTRVLSMHTVKPLDEAAVLRAARETAAIVTLEEHSVIGGLGSAVAEILAEFPGSHAPLRRLGLPSEFPSQIGGQEYLRASYGLSPGAIAASVQQLLSNAPGRAR